MATKRPLLALAALALCGGLLVSVAVAQSGGGETPAAPSPRAEGAPGAPWGACKRNHAPGTEAFRACVRDAAKARGPGVGGRGPGRGPGLGPGLGRGLGIGRACKRDHAPGSEAFRGCVRAQVEQRKEKRRRLRQAIRECRERHADDRAALRECVRSARRP